MGIKELLEPESVAVVGASASEWKAGNMLLRNIVEHGYEGRIYPITPHAEEVLGYRAYGDLLSVPDEIDVAFLILPGQFVKGIIEQCARKKVKAAVIVSAGFSEVGEEGRREQEEIKGILRRSGMRAIGPNTIGFVNVDKKLVASFVPFRRWVDGPVAVAAQSGILAGAMADEIMGWETQKIGFCKSISFGNKIDLDEVDYLEYTWNNAKVKLVAMHLESLMRPRQFFSLATRVKKAKPIIVLKAGRTDFGARAAASHTGSLAQKDSLVEASFRQYGLIRAYTVEEFLAYIKAFSYQPLPRGKRIGVITLSGANAVMASDEIRLEGLELARYSADTARRIGSLMPQWPVNNPADIWMALGSGVRKAHQESLDAVLDDGGVDVCLFIMLAIKNATFDGIKELFVAAMKRHPEKPIFVVMIGGELKGRWVGELEGSSVPIYGGTELAIKSIAAMYRYGQGKDKECLDPAA